jgi:hypothetical protein
MDQMRREILTWTDVDALIEHLLPQFEGEFDAMVMITRGGIIPGGLLAEAMDIVHILTAAVDFPAQMEMEKTGLYAWPNFLQFPEDRLLRERRTLVVDDVWGRVARSPRSRTGSWPLAASRTVACCISIPTAACSPLLARSITPRLQMLTSSTLGRSTGEPTASCWTLRLTPLPECPILRPRGSP